MQAPIAAGTGQGFDSPPCLVYNYPHSERRGRQMSTAGRGIPIGPPWFKIAVHSVVWLAKSGSILSSAMIASHVNSHATFLRRVMQASGIIRHCGIQGRPGWRLFACPGAGADYTGRYLLRGSHGTGGPGLRQRVHRELGCRVRQHRRAAGHGAGEDSLRDRAAYH